MKIQSVWRAAAAAILLCGAAGARADAMLREADETITHF